MSDGVRIGARRVGHGPPLFALHGGPSSDSSEFGTALDPVGQARELFLIDQRGCGTSDYASPDTYTLSRLVADLDEWREAIRAEQVDLLAHSFGGTVAFEYARSFPQRVKSIVFVAGAITGWRTLLYVPAWLTWARLFWKNARGGDFVDFHLKYEVGNRACVETVRATLTTARADPLRAGPLTRDAAATRDIRTLDPSIRILGIYGRNDKRFLSEAAHLRRSGKPVVVVDNCGHFPYLEQPQIFQNAVLTFLTPATGSE